MIGGFNEAEEKIELNKNTWSDKVCVPRVPVMNMFLMLVSVILIGCHVILCLYSKLQDGSLELTATSPEHIPSYQFNAL